MNICVAGSVGLVSAACLSEYGWNGICFDKDAEPIEQLRCGCCVPIYEPRRDELLQRNWVGRISFSTEFPLAVGKARRRACRSCQCLQAGAVGFNYASIGRSCGPELLS